MIKWIIFASANFLFMLIALLLNPFVLLFVKENGSFPSFLKWFETWDAPHLFFDGTGEIQADWLDTHWLFLKHFKSIPWFHLYLCRLLWLYRNCGYGFAYYICGKDYIQEDVVSTSIADETGYLKVRMSVGDLFRWSGYVPYSIFGNKIGFDYYLGWKLKAANDNPPGKPIRAMIAMRINPWMGNDNV